MAFIAEPALHYSGTYPWIATANVFHVIRDVPFSFIFFPLFATLKSLTKGEGQVHPSFDRVFLSSLVSGCVAAFAVTPMDGKHVSFIRNSFQCALVRALTT